LLALKAARRRQPSLNIPLYNDYLGIARQLWKNYLAFSGTLRYNLSFR
jgi:hypothetical protein